MSNKAILPVLPHSLEFWGFKNLDILEKIHLRFCKIISNLKQIIPNIFIYGELGQFPISLS